jgi:hypothetical protein
LKDTSYGDYNSSLYQVSTDTNNLIASVYSNANFGNLSASYYTTGTIRTNASGKPFLNRNITITSSTAGPFASPVSMRIYISKKEYDDLRAADATILSPADLRVVRSNNTSCITTLPSSVSVYQPTATGIFGSYRNGYVIDFQTTDFGTFYIAGYNAVLPVSLIDFNATVNKGKVVTNWICNQENQINNYEVEKSANAIDFTSVGKVTAINVVTTHSYSFTDNKPYFGKSFYRLRINDLSGHFQYSDIQPVYISQNGLISVYPNPANDLIQVKYNGVLNENAALRIINTQGQECMYKKITTGVSTTPVDIKKLHSGVYVVEIVNGVEISRIKFTKE